MLGLLPFTTLLLACLTDARSLQKRYDPNQAAQPKAQCTTNAQCLQLGLPLRPPRRPHLAGVKPHLDVRHANPLDNVTYTCGDKPDIHITDDIAGTYTFTVVGASGGSATDTDYRGGYASSVRGTIALTKAMGYVSLRPGCKGFDGPKSGGGGGESVFITTTAVGTSGVLRAVGGGGGGAGFTGSGVNGNIQGTAGTADSGGKGSSGSEGQASGGTGDKGGGGGGAVTVGQGTQGPKSGAAGATFASGGAGGLAATSLTAPQGRGGYVSGGGAGASTGGGGGGYSGGAGGSSHASQGYANGGGGGSAYSGVSLATKSVLVIPGDGYIVLRRVI